MSLGAPKKNLKRAYIQNHAVVPDAEAAGADGTYRYQTLDNREVPYNDLLLWEAGGVGIEGAAVPAPPSFYVQGIPLPKKERKDEYTDDDDRELQHRHRP